MADATPQHLAVLISGQVRHANVSFFAPNLVLGLSPLQLYVRMRHAMPSPSARGALPVRRAAGFRAPGAGARRFHHNRTEQPADRARRHVGEAGGEARRAHPPELGVLPPSAEDALHDGGRARRHGAQRAVERGQHVLPRHLEDDLLARERLGEGGERLGDGETLGDRRARHAEASRAVEADPSSSSAARSGSALWLKAKQRKRGASMAGKQRPAESTTKRSSAEL